MPRCMAQRSNGRSYVSVVAQFGSAGHASPKQSAAIALIDRFVLFRDLAPLIDEIQVDHAKCRISACECTMMTLHRLLSTVFAPARHSVPAIGALRRSRGTADIAPVVKFSSSKSAKERETVYVPAFP
jgi:hypothetical protein